MSLNQKLIEKNNVTVEQQENILTLHDERIKLFTLAESNLNNSDVLINIAKDVESIEFDLQKNWNFPKDANMHSWWFRIPGCKCPTMDNQDYIGTDMRIYNSECPIHGK